MKVLVCLALVLLCAAVEGQVICCSPYLDYQGYTDLYLGFVDLNLLPGTPPEAYMGLARVTSKYSEKLMKTEYIDWDIPGFSGLEAIVGDYRTSTARFYDVYSNGTCLYADYENAYMTPPCVPDFWQYSDSYFLGEDILVDRYGDDVSKNYINVLRKNCMPIAQFATRRNRPSEGIYRFNTEFYTNLTAYQGPIEIPQGCSPSQAPKALPLDIMPLHTISLRIGTPGEVFAETAQIREILKSNKKTKTRTRKISPRRNDTPKN